MAKKKIDHTGLKRAFELEAAIGQVLHLGNTKFNRRRDCESLRRRRS